MASTSLSSDKRSIARVAAAGIAAAPSASSGAAGAVAAAAAGVHQHEVVFHFRDRSNATQSLVEKFCASSGYGDGYVCLMGRTQLFRGK